MPPGESHVSHVSRISKEYYVNYFNSSHRELGPPVIQVYTRSGTPHWFVAVVLPLAVLSMKTQSL